MRRLLCSKAVLFSCGLPLLLSAPCFAQSALGDLWSPEVMRKVRDRSTLRPEVIPRAGYSEVFFDSESGDAKWADSGPPYAVHTGDTIRIHGYLASPASGGPHPGIVIGHGHGGHGSPELVKALAAFGYAALSIDGPRAGLSTGGPEDTNQAWISVEEVINEPSPEVGYLYHYAYAGMRGLTLLDELSRRPGNPFRIDRHRFGVAGASMGGQFTYYVNGIDRRVKGAVAIAVAGDWLKTVSYEGAWLYHGLYYYTRDGLASGQDALNTVSDVLDDPTMRTFLDHFDPIRYAPTQHGPLLTILGTHDQYFTMPAINTTYDRVAPARSHDPRFLKRILFSPNGKHGVIDRADPLRVLLALIPTIDNWFKYCFASGPVPPETPSVRMEVRDRWMLFRASVTPGSLPIRRVYLHVASQLDSTVELACDFAPVGLLRLGDEYVGLVPIGASPPCGPSVTPENVLYFVSASDTAGDWVSSKMHYRSGEMEFCSGFVPRIEHWRGDDFPVQPPPAGICAAAEPPAGRLP